MSNSQTRKPDSCSLERIDALFGHKDLLKEFDAISAFWEQQTLGQVNGQLLKIAKGLGPTNWHQHDDQDEAFLVIRGELIVETEEGSEILRSQHLHVVPRGVRHRTIAKEEAWFLVIGTDVTSTSSGGKPASLKVPGEKA